MDTRKKTLEKAIRDTGSFADRLVTANRKLRREEAERIPRPKPQLIHCDKVKPEGGGPECVYPHIMECILKSKSERGVLRRAEVLIRYIEQAMEKWKKPL